MCWLVDMGRRGPCVAFEVFPSEPSTKLLATPPTYLTYTPAINTIITNESQQRGSSLSLAPSVEREEHSKRMERVGASFACYPLHKVKKKSVPTSPLSLEFPTVPPWACHCRILRTEPLLFSHKPFSLYV